MLSAERRMQEGARDLSFAFLIGRTEEALWRLSTGQKVDAKDRSHFARLWHLLADASEAYTWAVARRSNAPPATALRALQAITPIVRSRRSDQPPEVLLKGLTDVARTLARADGSVSPEQLQTLTDVLRELASHAGGQGREALGSYAPAAPPALSKRLR